MYKFQKEHLKSERAWIELDMKNLRHNANALQKLLTPNCLLMPAIKANAYGHGAVLIAKELVRLGIRSFCVASVSEGIELRRNGICGELLILGYTPPEQAALLHKYHLTQTVVDSTYAKILNEYGIKLKVHIKVDTGMHRLGERSEHIEEISSIFYCKNLTVTGIFSHLCTAESVTKADRNYTITQAERFQDTVALLQKRGCSCGKVHLLASYGLMNYPQFAGDYARIGIALYGVLSTREDLTMCPVELKPVLSVKARIAVIKELYAGEGAGYGLQYTADTDRRIAVVSIGYADGIPRALSCGGGSVLVHGCKAPIIGRICMDQMLIDVTGIPDVKSGDSVVLIGKSGSCEITAYDLAEQCGTITNELLSRLGSRLNRIPVE